MVCLNFENIAFAWRYIVWLFEWQNTKQIQQRSTLAIEWNENDRMDIQFGNVKGQKSTCNDVTFRRYFYQVLLLLLLLLLLFILFSIYFGFVNLLLFGLNPYYFYKEKVWYSCLFALIGMWYFLAIFFFIFCCFVLKKTYKVICIG